jgi:hypothetical protein
LYDCHRVEQWKNFNFTPQEVKSWIDVGLDKWNDAEFTAYLRGKGYQPNQVKGNLKQLRKNGLPAQEYLDIIYPEGQRNTIKHLGLNKKNLTGSLDLSDFVNLEELWCWDNKLTSLNLSNCPDLVTLDCNKNKLANLILPKDISNLKKLNLRDNDFKQDLFF